MKNQQLNLTQGPILKTLIALSIPLMATALIQITYNFTDMIWVGKLGHNAVAAIGVSSFFVWIAGEFAVVARVGTSVHVAQEIGSNHFQKAHHFIKTGFYILATIVSFYVILLNIFAPWLVGFYQLNSTVSNLAEIYLRIVTLGFFVSFLNAWLSSLYHSCGNSMAPFKFNSIGLIINVLLDPIMIFNFNLGVLGAALATVFAQAIVTIIFVIDIIKKKNLVYDGFKLGRYQKENKTQIIKVGLPSGLQGIAHAGVSMLLSKYMAWYGEVPVAIYSVGAMIESITWLTTEGLQHGIVAFVGQNFGAGLYRRLLEVIKQSLKIIGSIGIISTVVLVGWRNEIFSVFLNESVTIVKMGGMYLLILGLSQFFMAMEIGAAGVFNGLGETKVPSRISMIFNLLRIPLALVLMPYFQFYGVWMAMTISSIFKGVLVNYSLHQRVKSLA